MPKGGKKRNVPTSSPEESPPKGKGADSKKSPEKLEVESVKLKHSPSKLEAIAREHLKSRSSIIKNLTNEQASEVGLRIFRKWVLFKERLLGKSGAATKKSKVEAEDEEFEELGAAAPKESFSMDKTNVPKFMTFVSEEIECLENIRLETDSERGSEKEGSKEDEDEDEEEVRIGSTAWEKYMFRSQAASGHKAFEMLAITFRDSADLVDRLTASMSDLKIKMSSTDSPERRPEVHQNFIDDLQLTKKELNNMTRSEDSLKRNAPESSKDKKPEEKSEHPSDDDDDDKSELS